MLSPFPGMDPYLEGHWGDVHNRLVLYSSDLIQERLPDDLVARTEEGVSVDYVDEEERRPIKPDVRIIDIPQPYGDEAGGTVSAMLVETDLRTELLVVPAEPPPERHIEIIDISSGGRVVTEIEFLSPTNKLVGYGREKYLRKQSEYLAAGVNLVEIDLVRQGDFSLAVPAGQLPANYRGQYLACIRQANCPREAAIVRMPLREKLKSIPIPLRPRDKAIALDLHSLIDQCYARGRYDRIDYSTDPYPPFGPADATWADELLRAAGRR